VHRLDKALYCRLKKETLQYMFHLNILSYEHVLIPEAVNICPMLKVCVSNVGDVEDGVFSLKESVMKM